MITRVPVFQQGAVCLTKFGPESGETAEEILARKDWNGDRALALTKTSFGGALAKREPPNPYKLYFHSTAATSCYFPRSKIRRRRTRARQSDALVWRKYRMLGGDILQDIPKHVLITSAAVTKRGTARTKHFALVCNSRVPLKIGGRAFRFSNAHYKNLGKERKTWQVRKRTADYRSIGQVDELSDFGSGVR